MCAFYELASAEDQGNKPYVQRTVRKVFGQINELKIHNELLKTQTSCPAQSFHKYKLLGVGRVLEKCHSMLP